MALTKINSEGERVNLTPEEIAGLIDHNSPEEIARKLAEERGKMIVSPWQFRKAINQLNLRDRVEQLIGNADQDTVDGWKVATSFQRLHPMVVQFGKVIPLTDAEMDELFELAQTL